ncbi:hypothetical protein QBC44DRAFT_234573 [Cladorrhinum sp. PSN332]|nr:hypothetical protein QBC44DRAFT_234573 [Cladorrhinum sp. PSN332]
MSKTSPRQRANAVAPSPRNGKAKGKVVKASKAKTETTVNQRAKPNNETKSSSSNKVGNLFMKLPAELRQEVFIQALRKPNIHHVLVKRQEDPADGTWRPTFYPFPGNDGSGYRLTGSIKSVCPDSETAVNLGNSKPMGMPFASKRLHEAKMDVEHDLICFDFKRNWKDGGFRNWNLDHQHMSRGPLDRMSMITGRSEVLGHAKRIAVTYKTGHAFCSTFAPVPFPCHCLRYEFRYAHRHLRICPAEFAGFLDCFPALEEVYIILYPDSKNEGQKDMIETYTKNFWSIPEQVRKERGYAVFHEAKRTYIELKHCIATDRRPDTTNSKYYKNVFRCDCDLMTADELLFENPSQYRLPRERRLAIKFKVLLQTDGECKGWGLDEKTGDYYRNFGNEQVDEEVKIKFEPLDH